MTASLAGQIRGGKGWFWGIERRFRGYLGYFRSYLCLYPAYLLPNMLFYL